MFACLLGLLVKKRFPFRFFLFFYIFEIQTLIWMRKSGKCLRMRIFFKLKLHFTFGYTMTSDLCFEFFILVSIPYKGKLYLFIFKFV